MTNHTVLGIDFGSVYWTAYILSDGQRAVVSDERGNRCIDASIYIRNNEIVIGSSARQLAQTYPDNVIHHPLCYLDNRRRNSDNEKQTSSRCHYVNDKPVFVLPYDGKEETVKLETVIVECFKKIVDLAVLSVNRKPSLTVISVPSFVYSNHKDFLIRCANKAQIPFPNIVCHHQSALTYFELSQVISDKQYIALLDLPSFSPTLSIISVDNKLYSLIANEPLDCVIGEEIDHLLYEYIMKEACKKLGNEVKDSKKATLKIRKEVESCKQRLSSTMTSSIMIESLFDGMDFTLSITRSRFEMLVYPVISKLQSCILTSLKSVNITKEDISQLYVFGGSAQIPCIQDGLKKLFDSHVYIPTHCDEVIAEGAALHASYQQEYQLRKEVPRLQQVSREITVKAGSWENVIVEKKMVLPFKKEYKWTIECDESIQSLSLVSGDYVIGEIPTQSSLNHKVIKILIVGNQFDGLQISIHLMNEENESASATNALKSYTIRIHE